MKPIETDIYEPIPDSPGRVRVVGQRTAQEVFAELKQRLDSVGYLPDEYFVLGSEWRNGRLMPTNADILWNADYGNSEGIYLDISLVWDEDGKRNTKPFATGKTLDDTGDALDRMHLVASAVMKAFHGDGGNHERYIKIGAPDAPTEMVLHLNADEHRMMVDALVVLRNAMREEFCGVEKLLRRATGSVIEYVNEVGERPLVLTAFDRAMLSIHDGNLDEFYNAYLNVTEENVGELLIHAAGRAGTVGRQMTLMMLGESAEFTNHAYLAACRKTVSTGDALRIELMMHSAERCVPDLDAAFHGEVISHAYDTNTPIAEMLIANATTAQISAASSGLLFAAVQRGDSRTMLALADKGIAARGYAEHIVRVLSEGRCDWVLPKLVEKGVLPEQQVQPEELGLEMK